MPIPLRDPERIMRRLEWTVIRRLDGLLHGDYRTLFLGAGLDLADLREYQYHDDVRHIDWNVTARLDAPYVREYHEDRDLTAWFLADCSPSIDFGSRTIRKSALAQDFVAVLARVLSRHGNRVAAALWGDALHAVIPPGAGRRHVLTILKRMIAATHPGDGRVTDVGAFLHAAHPLLTRRSLVFVLSDFISDTGFGDALGRLAERHEVIAVRLHDPLEAELPDLGLVTVEDAETGEQLFVDTHDRAFRRRFVEAAERREAALRRTFRDAGVDALELSTQSDVGEAILRFAELRRLRRRLAGGAILPRGGRRPDALPVA
ncbi:MAG: DUF58 domain-containing protein [Proteobacteria bacterium]|jgi:uncharacterized protein (DUF58 family)|nr:DUF58 domain-containing protein [Pseudomonadota bacterium]